MAFGIMGLWICCIARTLELEHDDDFWRAEILCVVVIVNRWIECIQRSRYDIMRRGGNDGYPLYASKIKVDDANSNNPLSIKRSSFDQCITLLG